MTIEVITRIETKDKMTKVTIYLKGATEEQLFKTFETFDVEKQTDEELERLMAFHIIRGIDNIIVEAKNIVRRGRDCLREKF